MTSPTQTMEELLSMHSENQSAINFIGHKIRLLKEGQQDQLEKLTEEKENLKMKNAFLLERMKQLEQMKQLAEAGTPACGLATPSVAPPPAAAGGGGADYVAGDQFRALVAAFDLMKQRMDSLEHDKKNFGDVLTAQIGLTSKLEAQLQDLRKDVTTRADALEQCQTDITSRVGALEKFQSEALTVRKSHDQALTDFDGRIGRCVTDLASLSKKLEDAQAQLQTDLDKFAAKDALDALEGKITGLETIPTQISALEVQLAAVREEAKKNHDSFDAYQVVASTRFALKDAVDFLAVSIDKLENSASSALPSAATGTIPVGIVATNVSHVNTMEKLTHVEAELTRICPAVQRLTLLVDSHEEKQKKLDGFFKQTLDTVEPKDKVTLDRLVWAEQRQNQALKAIYSCLGETFDVKNPPVLEDRLKPALEQIGTIKNQIGTIQAFLDSHLEDFTNDSTNAPSFDQILGGITTTTDEIRAQVDKVEKTFSGFTALANLVAESTTTQDAP